MFVSEIQVYQKADADILLLYFRNCTFSKNDAVVDQKHNYQLEWPYEVVPSTLNLCIGDAKQVLITISLSSLFVGDSPSIGAVGTLLLGTLLGLRVRSAPAWTTG